MKQQKVNSCFNNRRQLEHPREKVIDAKDVQVQQRAERRESSDVRMDSVMSRAGGEMKEAGERRRDEMTRGKHVFTGKGEVRREAKGRRGDPGWQEDRELVKNRIHVNGIPPDVGETELGDFFSAFGRSSDRIHPLGSFFLPLSLLYNNESSYSHYNDALQGGARGHHSYQQGNRCSSTIFST